MVVCTKYIRRPFRLARLFSNEAEMAVFDVTQTRGRIQPGVWLCAFGGNMRK